MQESNRISMGGFSPIHRSVWRGLNGAGNLEAGPPCSKIIRPLVGPPRILEIGFRAVSSAAGVDDGRRARAAGADRQYRTAPVG